MLQIAKRIDKLNIIVGGLTSFLSILLVVNVFISVIQRYMLNSSSVWQAELSLAISSFIFLICAGYTLYFNSHVRVDIAYEKCCVKSRAKVNIAGTLLLLFPMCAAIIYFSSPFIFTSWKLLESSPEYGGIIGVFVIKTFIWGFAVFLILQGFSLILNSLKTIMSDSKV